MIATLPRVEHPPNGGYCTTHHHTTTMEWDSYFFTVCCSQMKMAFWARDHAAGISPFGPLYQVYDVILHPPRVPTRTPYTDCPRGSEQHRRARRSQGSYPVPYPKVKAIQLLADNLDYSTKSPQLPGTVIRNQLSHSLTISFRPSRSEVVGKTYFCETGAGIS